MSPPCVLLCRIYLSMGFKVHQLPTAVCSRLDKEREVEGEEEVSLQAADSPVMHAALCRKLQQEKEEEGIYNYKHAPVFKNFTESSSF